MLAHSASIAAVNSQNFDRLPMPDGPVSLPACPCPLKVLVIDDSDDDFLIARRTLRLMDTFDVTVHHARDLTEAKALTDRLRFDVLLVDFCLGLETGASAIHELGGRISSAVQILLTGMPGQDVPHIALRAGAVHCLNKNHLTPALLETAILSALHTHWLEKRLQDAVTDLELANRAMSEFFARIGHDLKTPLNAIVDRAALMATEQFEPTGRPGYADCAEGIMADSRYVTDALDGFIQDALRDSAVRYRARAIVDLAEIVRAAVRSVARERERRGQLIELSLPEGRAEVVGQCSLLSLAFVNAMHDAVEQLRPGGTIRVGLAAEGSHWALRIDAKSVGSPAWPAECGDRPGSGLGTVSDIVTSHGGTFACEDTPDGGRLISLIVPAAVPGAEEQTDHMPRATR